MNSSNGNFLDEDGNVVNLVELLKTGKATPVVNRDNGRRMNAHSGWFTDENGTPVNIIALIDAAIDEGGGSDEPAIGGISVNGGNVVTPDENGIINLTISGDGSTVIDSELSKSSTNPVQNKIVAGEIEDLNEAVDSLNGSLGQVVNNEKTTTDAWEQGYIVYANGTDGELTTRIRMTDYVSFSDGIYSVKTLSGYTMAVFAWYIDTGAYVGGWMTKGMISKSGTLEWVTNFNFENRNKNLKYRIVLKRTDGTDISITEGSNLLFVAGGVKTDETLSIKGAIADAGAVGDRIAEVTEDMSRIEGVVFGTEEFTLSGQYSYWINGSNKWESTGASAIMFIREGAIAVDVTANDSARTMIAFLTTNAHVRGTTPDFVEGTNKIEIPKGTSKRLDIPDGTEYIYIAKTYKEYTYIPERLVWVTAQVQKGFYPLGLHEMPSTKTGINIVKRCRQMTEIKWTPAVDLQRFMLVARDMSSAPDTAANGGYNYLGTFKAGVEYKGIPYGRVSQTMDDYGYTYGTVGNYIGFDTFISAVRNPHSKISKERIGSVSSHTSIIYATVCSGFVCYVLDVPEVSTASIPNIQGLNLIGKINDNGTLLEDSKIKIGNIINLSNYHTAVITDIIRDDDGVIQFVELSDASSAGLADRTYADGQIGGLCRRKGWTREQFFKAGSWGDYSVYRYNGIVNYTPSPYVNIGDEFDMYRIEHFPIMPYEGENFKYKSGHIPNSAVKLVLNLTNYSHVRAFKDGEEVTGSPFAIASETESVDIDTIDAGTYYAYLCNISDGETVSVSYPCHWTIE